MSAYHFDNRSQHLGHSMRAQIETLDTSSRRNAPHVLLADNCPKSLYPRSWQTDYSQDFHSPTRFANYSDSHTQAQGPRPRNTYNHHAIDTEGVFTSSRRNDPTPSYQPTTPAGHHRWLSTPPHLLRPPPDYYVWETVVLLRRQVTVLEETMLLMRRELSELRRQSRSDIRVHPDQEDPFVQLSHLPESVLRDFKAAHPPYLEGTFSVSHQSLFENAPHDCTGGSLDTESSIGGGRSQ
ncbi:hypothetical protein CCMSSC00406_0008093 [Pleurotus cornucopiae]|uniref:Uncharacterized protein n=1 Tax=Pleurotus cornucopiae TaxID=5321 RepID=A0ACB7IKC6_PLECO|nr:hypothetical protein CCMSSC00406_0008093 [Pleurotus cornucopiae]